MTVLVRQYRMVRNVRQLDIELRDDEGRILGHGRVHTVDLDSRADYPSQELGDHADLWLVQEALDGYLSGCTGRIAWLDSLQKAEGAVPATNLSAAFRVNWPQLFEELGRPQELLLYPYPLDVYDEEQAKVLQTKIRQRYLEHMGAEDVPGYPFLRLKPPR